MAVHAQGGVRPVVVRALASHVHLRSAPAGHHRADARRAEAAHRHQVPGETPHRSGRQPHELEAGDRARRDQRRGGARAELRAREGGGVRPHPRAGQLGDDRSALRIIRGARPTIPSPLPPRARASVPAPIAPFSCLFSRLFARPGTRAIFRPNSRRPRPRSPAERSRSVPFRCNFAGKDGGLVPRRR